MSSRKRLSAWVLTSAMTVVLLRPPVALAERQDARRHYDKATAAFGLGKYDQAASEYEAAFQLRPDAALLYNAAQSYRLAGRAPRAAELYRNYLRLYGDAAPNAEDAREHLARLVPRPEAPAPPTANGSPHVASSSPRTSDGASTPAPTPAPASRYSSAAPIDAAGTSPSTPLLASAAAPLAPSAASATFPAEPAPAFTNPPSPVEAREANLSAKGSHSLLWTVAVAAVVVVAAGGVAFALSRKADKDPFPNLGTVNGN